MRFLLFNIVVAGALVFLFTSDKADLHAAADRAHDAANDIKSKAYDVIGAKEVATSEAAAKPASVTDPAKPAETAPVRVETLPARAETRSTAAAPETSEETFSQNKPLAPAAAEAVREVQVATRQLVDPVPPEVEKRREEVMAEGIVGGPVNRSGGRVTSGEKFMPASTRKRDLMLLSEEMELFSAEAISR